MKTRISQLTNCYQNLSFVNFSLFCLGCLFLFFFLSLPSLRRQYQPLSLQRLQYLIDLGRVDPTQPIDLTQLTNARGVTVQPLKRDYGVQLVEEVCRQHTWYFRLSVCHSHVLEASWILGISLSWDFSGS